MISRTKTISLPANAYARQQRSRLRGGLGLRRWQAGYENRVRFFWALVAISILSFSAYIYAINVTTRNIATRQVLERQIAAVSTNLDSLEFAYIELKNDITIELAREYGFREVNNPLYVSRAPSASLSFNTLD